MTKTSKATVLLVEDDKIQAAAAKALLDEFRKKNREFEEVLLKAKKLTITDGLMELFNKRYFEAATASNLPELCLLTPDFY